MKTNEINTTQPNNNAKATKKIAAVRQKIVNWHEYNQSLISRGNISVYISEALAKKAFLKPKKTHQVGHPQVYQDNLILFILTIRELCHLPLRQTVGLVAGLLSNMRLSWVLPDYSTLSRRMEGLNVDFCHKFHSKNVVLLLDSSGFKVFGEGEWKVRKHGYSYRRTWRKTHIAVDFTTRNIMGITNTQCSTHDNSQLRPLLRQASHRLRQANNQSKQASHKHSITTVIGDGAYDAKDNYLLGRKLGVKFIAPPPKNATEHLNMYHYQHYDTPGWEERNKVIRHIERFGLDGWQADVNYHRRSVVENTFYRLKTSFGPKLRSRKEDTQYTEQCIRASLINRFNALGLPRYAT